MGDPTAKLAPDAMVGRSVRHFRIDKKLGEGGMGAVYRAMDTKLERAVALKVIRPELCENPDFLKRFQREAKAAARFKHPNAIEIYEYGDGAETDGLVYMAFEFVNGRELRDLIRERGHLDAETSISIIGQVLSALERAHAQGIVHRDLKPQNVMIEAAHAEQAYPVKILDFGIAKLREQNGQSAALTQAGQIMGTVAYMSPEQTEGLEVDARSDLYAVGVVLFQMLTGKLPYNGKSALEVIKQHRTAPVPSAREQQPDVPETLDAVVKQAMAKKPEARFQTAREFRLALQALGLGSAGSMTATSDARQIPTLVGEGAKGGTETPARDYKTGATGKFFEALEGRTLDEKYFIESKLGEGGMGAVFKAKHLLLGSALALKVVHPQLADRKDITERFLREARAALEFVHPNAIPTRDFGRTRDGLLYMTQDFSPGKGLRKILQEETRLEQGRALLIVRQALSALAEAHAKGIVHRDLKPENMLVEKDDVGELVRVCDFGIAKILDTPGGDGVAQSGESLTGMQVIGTPHYMAPEQACADPVDGRTDVYAMGCVLYELLTGKKPFVASSAKDVLMKQISVAPMKPREKCPEANISPAVEAVVLKALEKEASARFQSAGAFIEAIDATGVELPRSRGMTSRIGARGPNTDLVTTLPPGAPPRGGSRLGLVVGVLGLLLVVLGALAWMAPEDTFVGGKRASVLALIRGTPPSTETTRSTETTPPRATETTTPPRATETTTPPRATETTPTRATEAAPPRATEAAPPRATEAAPPRATEAAPPRATEAAPPRATETAPPRATETAPPPATENDIPTAESVPEAEPYDPAGPATPTGTGVVERPIDPFPGTSRDTPTTPATTPGTGRTTRPGDPDYDTGRSATPQTPGRTDAPGQASIVEVNGVTFKFLRISDQRIDVRGRTVEVRDLSVSATEVTVGQYREYVRAHPARPRIAEPLRALLPSRRTGRTARRNGDQWDAIPDEALGQPITGVDYRIAKDLAAWFGMRLPTEAEWLAAARAAGGRTSIPGNVVQEIATFLNSTPEWTEEETVGSVDRSGAPVVGAPRDGTFGVRLAR